MRRLVVPLVALVVIVAVNRDWFADRLEGDDSPSAPSLYSSDVDVSQHYEEIQLGMTTLRVRAILGEPDSKQNIQSEGSTLECWYYDPTYQFCFDNARLRSKADY